MWKDKLKEIIYILENSNVNEIDLSFWGTRYRVVKNPGTALNAPANNNSVSLALDQSKDNAESVENSSKSNEENGEKILSPMPGTFYAAPSPEANPFVKEGDLVVEGDTLCIIEAMKIMNNIEAEQSGRIIKILVENGKSVEYNQPLFEIKPS